MRTSPLLLLLLSVSVLLLSHTVGASYCASASTAGDKCSLNVFGGPGDLLTTCSAEKDSVTVNGNVTINTKFNTTVKLTGVPCIRGLYCYPNYAQELGSFCDLATHLAGAECGSAGVYSLTNSTFYVPETAMNYTNYMSIGQVKLYLAYSAECESGRTTNSFAKWLGFSVIPLAGVATAVAKRRRRRPLLIIEGGSDDFVEMGWIQQSGTLV
jgi:hypothetical protein